MPLHHIPQSRAEKEIFLLHIVAFIAK